MAESAFVCFFILQKHVLVLWVHTNKRLYRLLLVSVWAEMKEYFTSKWVHRRLHLSCSSYCSVSTLHTYNIAHFSRLILDWVLCKVASCYVSDAWMCDHSFSSGGFCSSAEALVDGDHRGWDSGVFLLLIVIICYKAIKRYVALSRVSA